jgi:hypothetical protein
MTDQDVAFAIAQWCSGITQKEIAGHFGYKDSSSISSGIDNFVWKYHRIPHNGGGNINRKALAKIAFYHFMAQREAA